MEIPLGKSETMALLGQDPVRCKFVVDNKCLNISVVKFSTKMEEYSTKTSKVCSNTGKFKLNSAQKISIIKYIMRWLPYPSTRKRNLDPHKKGKRLFTAI